MQGRLIAAARGDEPGDLLLTHARVVNVFSGQIEPADVLIRDGRVASLRGGEAAAVEDMDGLILCPGFIDPHFHLESSLVTPSEFARAVMPRGTTTVVADPHEIANVLGAKGIRAMLAMTEGLPLQVFFMVPSCVPATEMGTAGARLEAADFPPLLAYPKVIGLAEVMNFAGVIHRDLSLLAKLEAVGSRPVDGHAPGLSGRDLEAYAAAGISSEHECTTLAEAQEKLRLGIHIFLREGSAAHNLADLLPLVTASTAPFTSFCSDDRNPLDLRDEGHIDLALRKAVRLGLDPITAVRMATLYPARHYRLEGLGAVAPGYRANLAALPDLRDFRAERVYSFGMKVAEGGKALFFVPPLPSSLLSSLKGTFHLDPQRINLRISAPMGDGTARVRVIGLIPGQILTLELAEEVPVRDGFACADPQRDLLKLAVIERHHNSGRVGLGFVRGFGLRRGALASSVAHDSHNLLVVGSDDREMLVAARAVAAMGGGQVVVEGEHVIAALPLPLAGLMSDLPLEEVCQRVRALSQAARSLGCVLEEPMMALSFLALPVVPQLRLTDLGLVVQGRCSIVD
ncbi:MAG: adenine deaminase [bacterium]